MTAPRRGSGVSTKRIISATIVANVRRVCQQINTHEVFGTHRMKVLAKAVNRANQIQERVPHRQFLSGGRNRRSMRHTRDASTQKRVGPLAMQKHFVEGHVGLLALDADQPTEERAQQPGR
jgi:hypothetical protein